MHPKATPCRIGEVNYCRFIFFVCASRPSHIFHFFFRSHDDFCSQKTNFSAAEQIWMALVFTAGKGINLSHANLKFMGAHSLLFAPPFTFFPPVAATQCEFQVLQKLRCSLFCNRTFFRLHWNPFQMIKEWKLLVILSVGSIALYACSFQYLTFSFLAVPISFPNFPNEISFNGFSASCVSIECIENFHKSTKGRKKIFFSFATHAVMISFHPHFFGLAFGFCGKLFHTESLSFTCTAMKTKN